MPITRVGEINVEYYVEGRGPPLLMIMGYSLQASSWGEPFLERLRPHFSTIRFSNRGTGLSDNPEVATTIRMMADDSGALMDALGIPRAHVLGISMGGMIAQELALNHQQRVLGLVLGCTLPGGTHGVAATPETMSMVMPVAGLSSEECSGAPGRRSARRHLSRLGGTSSNRCSRPGLRTPYR